MEGLQISLGAALTVGCVIGAWIVGITTVVVTLQVKVNGLRHMGALLTFMNQATITLAHISETLSRLDRGFEKHQADDQAGFQKIWSKLDDDLTPLEGQVKTLERDVDRLTHKVFGGAAE